MKECKSEKSKTEFKKHAVEALKVAIERDENPDIIKELQEQLAISSPKLSVNLPYTKLFHWLESQFDMILRPLAQYLEKNMAVHVLNQKIIKMT